MKLKKFENFEPKIRKELLIKQKKKFIPLLEENDLSDSDVFSEFKQYDKWVIINFLKNGNPSEWYLEKLLNFLKEKGIDTSSIKETEEREIIESFNENEIIFTGKRNPRLIITVKISPDRRISQIDNKTGIRFPFNVGQPLSRNIETWACNNNFLMDGKDTCPEKKIFGVRASDVPQGHEWRHIFPHKFK